jgi:CheY-like chemotaxis protein
VRARWRQATLSELAEPGYIDFALDPAEDAKAQAFLSTDVSPMAAKLLSLEQHPAASQRPGDAPAAVSPHLVLDACHEVAVHGGQAAVVAPTGEGQSDSIVVRKVFESQTGFSVELTCPTAMARMRMAQLAVRALESVDEAKPDEGAVRALVVDDDVDGATTLCYLLEILGFETAVAFSGPQSLGVAALFDPHLMFIDFDMPGMDGCEALRQLRMQESEGRRTFICFSGRSAPDDHRKCRDAGFDQLVTKPMSFDRLRQLAAPCLAAQEPAARGAVRRPVSV